MDIHFFFLSFWKLAHKYKCNGTGLSQPTCRLSYSDSRTKGAGEYQKDSFPPSRLGQPRTYLQTLCSDSQLHQIKIRLFTELTAIVGWRRLVRLTLRAFATLLGILTAGVFWMVSLTHQDGILTDAPSILTVPFKSSLACSWFVVAGAPGDMDFNGCGMAVCTYPIDPSIQNHIWAFGTDHLPFVTVAIIQRPTTSTLRSSQKLARCDGYPETGPLPSGVR
ncbi:hypothetical protein VP01_3012g1 [Puccinia sorghi]|uniref:Uncharacterized protein n=1 Tax=Puccinia sorghi TaxID=27349 RepID=A0A0L6V213_9BASI|nr:hypothetical protein VP01_3012g1 [Puccinia sorghi]